MNIISEIAKLLDVEIGEIFKIEGYALSLWRLDPHKGLLVKHNEMRNWTEACGEQYMKLLNGFYKIEHLPFKPKENETYWYVYWNPSSKELRVLDAEFCDTEICYQHKFCKNCFPTREKAEAQKYNIYKELTGKQWK